MGFWAFVLYIHLLFGLGIAWVQALSPLPSPCPLLFHICRLADNLAKPLHCSYYDITHFFTSLLPLALRTEAFASPFLTYFLLLGFTGQRPCWASPFHSLGFLGPFHSLGFLGPFHSPSFLSPFSSSLPLSLSWAFAKSFGLSQPNYHIFTSYYLSGLLAFMPTLWIY